MAEIKGKGRIGIVTSRNGKGTGRKGQTGNEEEKEAGIRWAP